MILEDKIGYNFSNKKILNQALTLPATAKEMHDKGQECKSQECLSLLGDGLLKGILVERLLSRYENVNDVSDRRAVLESNEKLPDLARDWGLKVTIESYNKSQGDVSPNQIADTIEALIGAVYRDGGYEKVKMITNLWYDNQSL